MELDNRTSDDGYMEIRNLIYGLVWISQHSRGYAHLPQVLQLPRVR